MSRTVAERYAGQDIAELIGFVVVGLLLLTAFAFFALWEPDPVEPAAEIPQASTVTVIPPSPERVTVNATPTPEPTKDWSFCSIGDNCYKLREFTFWFRSDVEGIQSDGRRFDTGDLRTFATVYGYKFLPQYHWHDLLWGSRSFRLQKPQPGMQYLFVYINIYSDDLNGAANVLQYGYEPSHFTVQVEDRMYYPVEDTDPTAWIKELQETWDYGHIQNIGPYGYRIVQEAGTGIITAQQLDRITAGRSNAWDGYICFEVPANATPENTRVHAQFDNLGGTPNWQLSHIVTGGL